MEIGLKITRVNVEELEVVESTSSGSVDGLSHNEKKAKESIPRP